MRVRVAVIGVVAASGLVLGACGSDENDSGGGGGGVSTSIEATASEFEFEPDSWTVPAGEEFTIDFKNDGSVPHEWAVIKLGEDLASEDDFAEDKILFEVEEVPADDSTTEKFTVDEAGTYQVICGIPTHFDAGMKGSLTVE